MMTIKTTLVGSETTMTDGGTWIAERRTGGGQTVVVLRAPSGSHLELPDTDARFAVMVQRPTGEWAPWGPVTTREEIVAEVRRAGSARNPVVIELPQTNRYASLLDMLGPDPELGL